MAEVENPGAATSAATGAAGGVPATADSLAVGYTDIFRGLDRLGPGRSETTAAMLQRAKPFLPAAARIAEMGCGTGSSAVDIALSLPLAQIIAVDALPVMARACRERARRAGVAERVTVFVGDMCGDFLSRLGVEELDLIWAESSIYAVGRHAALAAWAPLLRPGGWILFSDLVWLAAPDERPRAAASFWQAAYPEMAQPGAVVAEIAAAGLLPVSQHVMAGADWQAYYGQLPPRLAELRGQAAPGSPLAAAIAALEEEMQIFESGFGSYSSAFFVARRPPRPIRP